MNYSIHPNAKDIQKAGFKGYQGMDPKLSPVIILGLDANWPCCLVMPKMMPNLWNEVQTYLRNPVDYWKSGIGIPYTSKKSPAGNSFYRPIHHPLISDAKRMDGLTLDEAGGKYHKTFNQHFKFSGCYADCITFLELLGIPTVGSTNKIKYYSFLKDPANHAHLKLVENAINNVSMKDFKLLLLSSSVLDAIKMLVREGFFSNISFTAPLSIPIPGGKSGTLDFFVINNKTLWCQHRHFSAYGKNGYTPAISMELKKLIDCFCHKCSSNSDIKKVFPDGITKEAIEKIF